MSIAPPPFPPQQTQVPSRRALAPAYRGSDNTVAGLVPAGTLAVWIGCVAGGIVGVLIPYVRPKLAVKEPPPVMVERIAVDLSKVPALSEGTPATVEPTQTPPPIEQIPDPDPPAPPEAVTPPDAPPLAMVATPSPEIFAVPVQGPSRVVNAKQAVPVARAPGPAAPSPLRHLTMGVGEGAQIEPEYPREAILGREQGTVGMRFTVGEDGRVSSVQVASPCRWPLLNEAAARAIRDQRRYNPGPIRYYDISIEFKLSE